MLQIGDRTSHGTVVAILWIGERYYSFNDGGAICLVPAVLAEQERPIDSATCIRVAHP